MITQENFVRLRTHHNNIQRYRELLETSLTVFERQYIERQLSEEQLAIETLAAEILGGRIDSAGQHASLRISAPSVTAS